MWIFVFVNMWSWRREFVVNILGVESWSLVWFYWLVYSDIMMCFKIRLFIIKLIDNLKRRCKFNLNFVCGENLNVVENWLNKEIV